MKAKKPDTDQWCFTKRNESTGILSVRYRWRHCFEVFLSVRIECEPSPNSLNYRGLACQTTEYQRHFKSNLDLSRGSFVGVL